MNDYAAGKAWKLEKKQHILETAFTLFSERGIEQVTMPEIADASKVGRATLYRYFETKLDLVLTITTSKWETYIKAYRASVPAERVAQMTAGENLRFFMDSFLDLYRNHRDVLRFNYNFNSYMRYAAVPREKQQSYLLMIEHLRTQFHRIYVRGLMDGTLNTQIGEDEMLSSIFHIMLAAVTRFSIGLIYAPENGSDPEKELVILEELLLSRFVRG
ncbi:MAG: TetR/AcrR family transcriptional regulator [Oscillospiraceae bacterium]|nr:TetR/AcrR family transcriptional regulator [Oscillospiraceae bacterium]